MPVYFVCKTTSMVIIFFESFLSRANVHIFTISTIIIITIIGSADIHLKRIYYAFILAFALKGISGLINIVTS